MTTLAAQIDATGITAPDYADIYAQLQNAYWTIYGSDADLDPDSQDGQLIAIFAQAIYDVNQLAVAVFNAYSPVSAQGAGLSSIVKINGIRRDVPTASTAPVTLTGTANTSIVGASVGDDLGLGTQWSIPNCVIGGGGTVSVTATCTALGAVSAASGHLTEILTPIFGWQSVTSTADATAGFPVETDAALRQRQAKSTGLPATTPLGAVYASVANVAGVQRLRVYENDTDSTNGLGIPSHSICAVAEGGDPVEICTAIALKKSPGTGTFGTTSEVVVDPSGVPDSIHYDSLTVVPVTVAITVHALAGWVAPTGVLIQQSIAAYLSGLGIGVVDYLARLYAPANLSGDAAMTATGLTQAQLDVLSATYTVTALTQSRPSDAPPAVQDVPIAFNEAAQGAVARVVVTVA